VTVAPKLGGIFSLKSRHQIAGREIRNPADRFCDRDLAFPSLLATAVQALCKLARFVISMVAFEAHDLSWQPDHWDEHQ
jgi:hypothetical protein